MVRARRLKIRPLSQTLLLRSTPLLKRRQVPTKLAFKPGVLSWPKTCSFFFSLSPANFVPQKILSFFLGFFLSSGLSLTHRKNLDITFSGVAVGLPSPSKRRPTPLDKKQTLLLGRALLGPLAPVASPLESAPLSLLFFNLAGSLAVTYRVVFVGLSRRLRKIVKNKYRFRRQYVCVLPASRLRYGFHLVRFCLKFVEGKTKSARLLRIFEGLLADQPLNPVHQIRSQQQKHVLGVLRKQYLLS
jgi:hypothetical protein